ncbi:hypothetical protein ACMG4M_05230 [Alcanivorax sp. IL3]|uniref:hypothetical protein n=1 Tax=unclassified Alcanivorax TaxID=2638842 RepID=UPI0039C06C77
MHPIRLLGKMTAKGLLIDGAGFGSGPVAIRPVDVAAALGMGRLPLEAALVGRAKFCDDNQAQLDLAVWVRDEFRRRCLKQGWKTDYCEGLAQLCVFELVHPMRCSECVGRGSLWQQWPVRQGSGTLRAVESSWEECGRCKGTGQAKLTVRSRAAVAGIGKSQFSDVWQDRADNMMQTLWSLEEKVLRHLHRQFSDEAA